MTYIGHIPAKDIQPGMYVDLEGDEYADPNSRRMNYRYIYMLVEAVEQETDHCIVIHFDNDDSVGFPTDHPLPVHTLDDEPAASTDTIYEPDETTPTFPDGMGLGSHSS
jgi:hypothetical protein